MGMSFWSSMQSFSWIDGLCMGHINSVLLFAIEFMTEEKHRMGLDYLRAGLLQVICGVGGVLSQ